MEKEPNLIQTFEAAYVIEKLTNNGACMTMFKLEEFAGNTVRDLGTYSTMDEAEQAAMDYTNSEECDFNSVLDITEIEPED